MAGILFHVEPYATVPNVYNMTQTNAGSTISGVGLIVGTVSTDTHETIVAGNVYDQDPNAGVRIPLGDPVNLDVSTGPAEVSVVYKISTTGGQDGFADTAGSWNNYGNTSIKSGHDINTSIWRFENVTIPQGATIISAIQRLWTFDDSGEGFAQDVYLMFEASDNTAYRPGPPGNKDEWNGLSYTSSVYWNQPTSWGANPSQMDSASIVTPLQAIINRVGWGSGGAVTLVWRNMLQNGYRREWVSEEHGSWGTAYSAELRVTYTT